MRKWALLVFLISFGGTSLPVFSEEGLKPAKGWFEYANAERTRYFRVAQGAAITGEIVTSRSGRKLGNNMVDREVSSKAYDCSDKKYRCLKVIRSVFAVPKGTLRSSMTYEMLGTKFKVLRCIRDVGDGCPVALISADCNYMKDAKDCAVVRGGRDKSSRPGPVAYFFSIRDLELRHLELSTKRQFL